MDKNLLKFSVMIMFLGLLISTLTILMAKPKRLQTNLEPFIYKEDFNQGELNAWASYPPNQDTAYDPYVYPGYIHPKENNKSLIIRCDPPWNQDQILGAVKLLNFVLDENFSLRFRYYLKTVESGSELSIHLPLSDGQRIIYKIPNPERNRWQEIKITWPDLINNTQNNSLKNGLQAAALAITVKFPKVDPSLLIYLGLDDIEVKASKMNSFQFQEPEVVTLSEWKERIVLGHYGQGQIFRLRGKMDFAADEIRLSIAPFTQTEVEIFTCKLNQDDQGFWKTGDLTLDSRRFPPGLYRGEIIAKKNRKIISQTYFTLFIRPNDQAFSHPRFFVSSGSFQEFRNRLLSSRFRPVLEKYLERAKTYRRELDLNKVMFDIDQFPAEDWIPSLSGWYRVRFMTFRESLYTNSVAYISGQDPEAALFIKRLLLNLATWPRWNHPWMENRGFHTYYPLGEFAVAYAAAYDSIYHQLTEDERKIIREGLIRNYIVPAYQTYVVDNQVTSNSSNWISHIAGGALVSLAIIYGDDPELNTLEPWLTGFLLKENKYIKTAFGSDGSYGEGYRYYNFAMQSLATAVPLISRIFNIDLSGPIRDSYHETLWSSLVTKNIAFSFGDTESYLKKESQAAWIGTENGPMNNWAWLLALTKDKKLSWLYHSLKEFDTLQEVMHETDQVSQESPDKLPKVRFFPVVGTAVFRSGWDNDQDFVFVFRSGPFYNHQHLDQGSFYLADLGEIFLEERYDGEHHYYDDPVYRSHAIQPISHNTILINRNPQSQKVGDPKDFAPGMLDQAEFKHWLDTPDFSFVSGYLEKVYIDKVKSLKRNILYCKPRIILLVDEIVPAKEDVEINRLFHARWKKEITPGDKISTIKKGDKTLFLYHLLPPEATKEVISEPHFLCQLNELPLIERGYLQVSGKTQREKLIFADLLIAGKNNQAPPLKIDSRDDIIIININADKNKTILINKNKKIIFSPWQSNALLLAFQKPSEILISGATYLTYEDSVVLNSDHPFYGYYARSTTGIYLEANQGQETEILLDLPREPKKILINREAYKSAKYQKGLLQLTLPAGPSRVEITGF